MFRIFLEREGLYNAQGFFRPQFGVNEKNVA